MIIAIELYKLRRSLGDLARLANDGGIIFDDEIWAVDMKIKEILDELERRENASGCREQSRETCR